MKDRKTSVLILYCGGTIGMRQDTKTSALQPLLTIEDLLKYTPLLEEEFHIDTHTITNIDSTNIQPSHWSAITSAIQEEYQNYDGFVVLHGTDTMAYTASALSYSLGNLGKPVILTGAQVPPDILGSDAFVNMVSACQASTIDFADVAILFGNRILRGNRSTKISEDDRNAFLSPVFPELGTVRLQPQITYNTIRRRHGGSLKIQNVFTGNVAVIRIVPGMNPSIIDSIVDSGIEGLILESFGPGNIPNKETSLLPSITAACKKGIPVLIATQCIYGTTRMYLYEVGQRAIELGVIPTGDMTTEAAFVKLKWALGQTKDPNKIANLFGKNIAGEVTIGE